MYVYRLILWRLCVFRNDHLNWVTCQGLLSDSPSLRRPSFSTALYLGIGPCRISPTNIGMSTDVIIIQVLLKQPLWFPGCGEPAIYERPHLTGDILVLWLFQSFYPISSSLPWALGVSAVLQIGRLGLDTPVPCSLHFDWVWISVMVPICFTKKLLWGRVRTTYLWE